MIDTAKRIKMGVGEIESERWCLQILQRLMRAMPPAAPQTHRGYVSWTYIRYVRVWKCSHSYYHTKRVCVYLFFYHYTDGRARSLSLVCVCVWMSHDFAKHQTPSDGYNSQSETYYGNMLLYGDGWADWRARFDIWLCAGPRESDTYTRTHTHTAPHFILSPPL
jgi:hypothetical protein